MIQKLKNLNCPNGTDPNIFVFNLFRIIEEPIFDSSIEPSEWNSVIATCLSKDQFEKKAKEAEKWTIKNNLGRGYFPENMMDRLEKTTKFVKLPREIINFDWDEQDWSEESKKTCNLE